MKKDDDTPSKLPQHQLDQLAILEEVAHAAEVFSRLDTLLGDICGSQGIDETVIAVVREKAKRKARQQLIETARSRLASIVNPVAHAD